MRFPASKKTKKAALMMVKAALLYCLSFQLSAKEIVFILSADLPGESAYYSSATSFYRNQHGSSDAAPVLVTTARSLAEVREVLLRADHDEPWGVVTLVAHGTPWRGMKTNIFHDGTSATLENIEQVLATGEFSPLQDSEISSSTIIRIESCGVGRRPDYTRAIALLLAGKREKLPVVEASSDFVAFVIDENEASRIAKKIELPVLIRTLRGDAKKLDSKSLSAILDDMRKELDKKMPGSGSSAIWVLSPINIHARVTVTSSFRQSAVSVARKNEAIRNLARINGLDINDVDWGLGASLATDGAQDLDGHGAFILMRANLDHANSIKLSDTGIPK